MPQICARARTQLHQRACVRDRVEPDVARGQRYRMHRAVSARRVRTRTEVCMIGSTAIQPRQADSLLHALQQCGQSISFACMLSTISTTGTLNSQPSSEGSLAAVPQ